VSTQLVDINKRELSSANVMLVFVTLLEEVYVVHFVCSESFAPWNCENPQINTKKFLWRGIPQTPRSLGIYGVGCKPVLIFRQLFASLSLYCYLVIDLFSSSTAVTHLKQGDYMTEKPGGIGEFV